MFPYFLTLNRTGIFFNFQAFPEADLKITLAGHSGMEVENIRELVAATEKFKLQ